MHPSLHTDTPVASRTFDLRKYFSSACKRRMAVAVLVQEATTPVSASPVHVHRSAKQAYAEVPYDSKVCERHVECTTLLWPLCRLSTVPDMRTCNGTARSQQCSSRAPTAWREPGLLLWSRPARIVGLGSSAIISSARQMACGFSASSLLIGTRQMLTLTMILTNSASRVSNAVIDRDARTRGD
jgi:hypothetical protein